MKQKLVQNMHDIQHQWIPFDSGDQFRLHSVNYTGLYKASQPFHLVEYSPWPLLRGFTIISMPVALIRVIKRKDFIPFVLTTSLIALIAAMWWRDISRESTYQGHHRTFVVDGLKIGMLLFIVREVLFFFSFFWAFFHSSLAPTTEVGIVWPPVGINTIDPFSVPLLNTAILLLSGVSVTWAHHRIERGQKRESQLRLGLTCALGIYFIFLQGMEYYEARFAFSDSVFGSTFFIATGFHGVHVIVGTIFLTVISFRLLKNHFTPHHHVGFLTAAWYWHFVDVVWLFLFVSIYWWGG